MRRAISLAVLAAGLALLNLWSATAALPVLLDPAFGTSGGSTILDIAGGYYEDETYEIVRQPDGKYLTPGKSYNGPGHDEDFTLIRWNANGTLDSSFGVGGIAKVDFFGAIDEALAMALQPDGKIVIAGVTVTNLPGHGSSDMGLARFNANGTLDTGFATYGTPGVEVLDFAGGSDQAMGVVVLGDGKIVMAGYAEIPGKSKDFALARYNADGSLDNTFGWGGRVATDFFGGQDIITKIRVASDGKVVAAGMAFNAPAGHYDVGLAKYQASGGLDATFATAGVKGIGNWDFGAGDDIGMYMMLRYDGKIVVSGMSRSPSRPTNFDMMLAQFNADGTLDTNFATYGAPGVATQDFSGNYDQALALDFQPDGKILLAGHTVSPGTGFDYGLSRFLPDGNLDTSFGNTGRVTTDFFGGPDGAHAMLLIPEGRAIVTGDIRNPSTGGDDIGLSSYLVGDPAWMQGMVFTMGAGDFSDGTKRATILIALNDIKNDINANNNSAALTKLNDLRTHMDGCGGAPDGSDWIISCAGQTSVRSVLDQVIYKLGG